MIKNFVKFPRSAALSLTALAVLAAPLAAQEHQWTFQTSAQAGDNFFAIEEE